MTDLGFIISVMSIFAFFTALILLGLPKELILINDFDFTWFGGQMIAIASGCVVVSGIPCAVVLAIIGFLDIFVYIIVEQNIIKILIFYPITIGIIFILSKLGRGVSQ